MIRLTIRFDVLDYEAWRTQFDDWHASGGPAERGVREHAVYRDEATPNSVMITLDFDDADTAEAYVMNPDNKRVLEAGGVKGEGLLMSLTEILEEKQEQQQ